MNNLITQLLKVLPDSIYSSLKYKRNIGKYPSLRNPKTYSEKVNWLKLNVREPIQTLCADKYLVREFIKETIGEEYLIPLLFQTYDIKDLIPENLPDIPFIIKTNHDSQKPIIVYDKNSHDWEEIRNILGVKLNTNYYYQDREWQYKNIKPCIIVEKLMIDVEGNLPNDYKIHRLNGKANFIVVDKGRFKNERCRYVYDLNWDLIDFKYGDYSTKTDDIIQPVKFDKMIELSESFLKEFNHLRIDWYEIDGNLYIGEITFHPGGGILEIFPHEWSLKIGNLINLEKYTKNKK